MDRNSVNPNEDLIEAALQVQLNSRSKYSGFSVGCAIRLAAGDVYTGCNIESVSFGLSNCAERVAIGVLISAGVDPSLVSEILVVGPDLVDCTPCGACRQVLSELVPHATIWFRHGGQWVSRNVLDLMPDALEASLKTFE